MKYKTLESIIRGVVGKNTTKGSYTTLEHTIKRVVTEKMEPIEKDPNDQVSVGTYKTKHFDYSPEAQKLFSSLPKDIDPNKSEQSAVLHDKLFALLKLTRTQGGASRDEYDQATRLINQINQISHSINLKHTYLDKYAKEISNLTGRKKDASKTLPKEPTGELTRDSDVDQKSFAVSRAAKMQKKIKLIDDD